MALYNLPGYLLETLIEESLLLLAPSRQTVVQHRTQASRICSACTYASLPNSIEFDVNNIKIRLKSYKSK